jgi:hypothetical protein
MLVRSSGVMIRKVPLAAEALAISVPRVADAQHHLRHWGGHFGGPRVGFFGGPRFGFSFGAPYAYARPHAYGYGWLPPGASRVDALAPAHGVLTREP